MNKPVVKPIPDGMHALTPYLVCAGADRAIAFYKTAFGAVELSRTANAQGKLLNAQLRIGDSLLMLMDEFAEFGVLGPKSLKGSSVTVHHQVEDMDAVVARAVAAGATVKMPAKDEFWGDRIALLEDPFGHKWFVATHVREVGAEEVSAKAKAAMSL